MGNKGVLLVLLTAIVSGVSIFLNRFGVSGMDSTIFTFSKNILVALFLAGVMLAFNQWDNIKKLTSKQWWSLVLVGLVGGSIPFVLFFAGLKMTTGAAGSFVHKLMFIFVAILAFMFLKEKMSWKMIVPALLLVIGNYYMLNLSGLEMSFGLGLVLIATLFWAVENVISKRLLREMEGNVVAFGRMFFGSIFIFAYILFSGKVSVFSSLGMGELGWIAITSLLLLAYVMTWYNGLKSVSVSTATCILLLGSPITTLLSLFFSGASVTLLQASGLIMVVLGVISLVLLDKKLIVHANSTA
ncbi:DMT family transporter [Candidatus Woesearchaeota archaeon]|nr:DMT family transporter [Candidatus Woesearchaeota archaeon]